MSATTQPARSRAPSAAPSEEASGVKYWWLSLALVAAVPGGLPMPQDADLRLDLAKAQASWQARRPAAYEFTIEVRCFCPGIAKVPPSFRVVGSESSPVGELEAPSQRFYQSYNTIEKVFAAIERSLAHGQYKSTVQYDDKLGFPVVADLDPRRETADDELHLRVINFRAIEK
jgi:hypothetical protein